MNCYDADEMAKSIYDEVVKNKLTPPIAITHSLSTFVGQKYLESFPLKGLVMINPIPPSTADNTMSELHNRWKRSMQYLCSKGGSSLSKEEFLDKTVRLYYGVCSHFPAGKADLVSQELLGRAHLYANSDSLKEMEPFMINEKAFFQLVHGRNSHDASVTLEPGEHPLKMKK